MTNNINSAVIVIPTYNEAGTIGELVYQIYNKVCLKIKDWKLYILIVDGNSTDNTREIVNKLLDKYSNLHLLRENKKSGIGSAYLKGFKFAMHELKADVVIEFDADFQHPVETIPKLLNKINDGYDYVLGSRKIRGGGEPAGRNYIRLMLTNFGGWLARLILFFPSKYFYLITDPTTGLKATRVAGFLSKLNLDENHFYSKKFGYKVQLLSETIKTGARYAEIPLNFQNRLAGASKFENNTIKDVLISCIRTRINK